MRITVNLREPYRLDGTTSSSIGVVTRLWGTLVVELGVCWHPWSWYYGTPGVLAQGYEVHGRWGPWSLHYYSRNWEHR